MAIIIPVIAGISGLITGLGGGYLLFDNEEENTKITEKGIINNTVEIDKSTDSETTWLIRCIMAIIIMIILIWIALKAYKKFKIVKQTTPPRSNNEEKV